MEARVWLVVLGGMLSACVASSAAPDAGAPVTRDGAVARDAGSPAWPDGAAPDARRDGAAPDPADAGLAPPSDGAPGAADGGGVPPDASGAYLVPPVASCTPTGDACALGGPVTDLFATYRKDAWLPSYDELGDPPTSGGRVHVAAVSAVTGRVTRVLVDGTDVDSIYDPGSDTPPFEWAHVWPRDAVAGEPLWVAFHSRDAAWDSASGAELIVETDVGEAVRGTFRVAPTPVPLTYVTTAEDYGVFLIHLRNQDSRSHEVRRVLVNGRDVTDAACLASRTVGVGESALLTVPLCTATAPGEPWTVVVEYEAAPAAVGVGRVIRERFPVEAWPSSADCALPGATGSTFDAHVRAGIDTIFMYTGDRCGYDARTMVNTTAPATPGLGILLADDFVERDDLATWLTTTAAVAGFMTGDESDDAIYDDDGVPVPARKAAEARLLWEHYPEVPVYNGAKTNRNVGTFAGMTDIQGMDLYVAACAPHITTFGSHPPLRGAYDYLRNARDNHMPLPTWLYAQGLSRVWNQERPLVGGTIHVQPDPSEILVQALSVVAAGGKGLMWFQTQQEEAEHAPDRWDAVARASWMIRGVRGLLREGDVAGGVTSDGEALVEGIRARDALVVPVIGLATTATVDDIACAASFISEASVPHWRLARQDLTVRIAVPEDLGALELFEVTAESVVPVTPTVDGRELVVAVRVDDSVPARMFVVAATPDVRVGVAAALAR